MSSKPLRPESKNGALRDVKHGLAARLGLRRTKGNLLNLRWKLSRAPLADDFQATIPEADIEIARGKSSAENHLARRVRDIDEASRASDARSEARDVHISQLINLGGSEGGEIEPASIVESKLRRLINNRLGIF